MEDGLRSPHHAPGHMCRGLLLGHTTDYPGVSNLCTQGRFLSVACFGTANEIKMGFYIFFFKKHFYYSSYTQGFECAYNVPQFSSSPSLFSLFPFLLLSMGI
jgi:hypothetical protein